MVYSDCHNAPVHVNPEWTGMGGNAYICDKCNKPCRRHEPNTDDEQRQQLIELLEMEEPDLKYGLEGRAGRLADVIMGFVAAQKQQWEVAARKDELEQLKVEMRQHTVPESKGLITRSYLENTINFKIAQLGKEQ